MVIFFIFEYCAPASDIKAFKTASSIGDPHPPYRFPSKSFTLLILLWGSDADAEVLCCMIAATETMGMSWARANVTDSWELTPKSALPAAIICVPFPSEG